MMSRNVLLYFTLYFIWFLIVFILGNVSSYCGRDFVIFTAEYFKYPQVWLIVIDEFYQQFLNLTFIMFNWLVGFWSFIEFYQTRGKGFQQILGNELEVHFAYLFQVKWHQQVVHNFLFRVDWLTASKFIFDECQCFLNNFLREVSWLLILWSSARNQRGSKNILKWNRLKSEWRLRGWN